MTCKPSAARAGLLDDLAKSRIMPAAKRRSFASLANANAQARIDTSGKREPRGRLAVSKIPEMTPAFAICRQ
jgi:hypothetical protein